MFNNQNSVSSEFYLRIKEEMKRKLFCGDFVNLSSKAKQIMQLSLFLLVLNIAMFSSTASYSQGTNNEQSQQKTVTGIVTDSEGLPLIGVAVLGQGTNNGTVTNLDGDFSLTIPASTEVLQVSYIGYKKQEIVIGSQSVFNIT
ncbi:carboxypeptidase-like regulatory domain-containing protein, partial [Winogradskyella psychrotolerans]